MRCCNLKNIATRMAALVLACFVYAAPAYAQEDPCDQLTPCPAQFVSIDIVNDLPIDAGESLTIEVTVKENSRFDSTEGDRLSLYWWYLKTDGTLPAINRIDSALHGTEDMTSFIIPGDQLTETGEVSFELEVFDDKPDYSDVGPFEVTIRSTWDYFTWKDKAQKENLVDLKPYGLDFFFCGPSGCINQFKIVGSNQPPVPIAIAPIELEREEVMRLNVNTLYTDADSLAFTSASSGNPAFATVIIDPEDPAFIVLTGIENGGPVTIDVAATDTFNPDVANSFLVIVDTPPPNPPPVPIAIDTVEIGPGELRRLHVNTLYTDADSLAFTSATSSNPAFATVIIDPDDPAFIVLTGIENGGPVTIDVAATDTFNPDVANSFLVIVDTPPPNPSPVPIAIDTVEIGPGELRRLHVNTLYTDADSLAFTSASSGNPAFATVIIDPEDPAFIILTGIENGGPVTIDVAATDTFNPDVANSFQVVVGMTNDQPPVPIAIATVEIGLGNVLRMHVNSLYSDTDPLLFTSAKSERPDSISVSIDPADSTFILLTGIGKGDPVNIDVLAKDSLHDPVPNDFLTTVNLPPTIIQDPVPPLSSFSRPLGCNPVRISFKAYFKDPESDLLVFASKSIQDKIASINPISDTEIEVNCNALGNTQILLMAKDALNDTVSTSLTFVVEKVSAPNVTAGEGIETTPLPVEATFSNNITKDIDRVEIHYRGGGASDTTFAVAVMDSSATADIVTYGFDIPGDSITVRGVEYFIQTVFKEGVFAPGITNKYRSEFESEPIFVENLVNTQILPAGEQRLISFPLNIDHPHALRVLWDDLGLPDNTKWRFFEAVEGESCNPDDADFREFTLDNKLRVEFNEEDSLKMGKAYWVIVDDPHQVDAGSGRTNVINKTFAIDLHDGWNLIGNPFAYEIPLGNVTFDDAVSGIPALYEYMNKSWVPAHSLKPYTGYALCQPGAESLYVNPQLAPDQSTPTSSKPDWAVTISAKDRQMRDVQNVASVVKDALDEWDPSDRIEPPWMSEFVSVYFSHPDWEDRSSRYHTDARPAFSDGATWNFEVISSTKDQVDLDFEDLEQVPEDFDVWLIDEVAKVRQNLRETPAYSVAGTSVVSPRKLMLIVGNNSYQMQLLDQLDLLPDDYTLSQNFPNPFAASTTIPFSLPEPTSVSLEIYDLLGKRVTTLLHQQEKAAGNHVALWDGRNTAGQLVASGVYFIRIGAGSFTQTRKTMLVK